MSIKSAEKANKEAKIAQGDIKKTIEIQKKTIASLNQFKNKIEANKHLEDIDILWSQTESFIKKMEFFSDELEGIINSINNEKKVIELLIEFKNKIESYEHLEEVDNIWSKCEENKINIMESKDIIETHGEEIENLKSCLQKIQKQSYEKNKVSFKKLKVAYTLLWIVIGILSGAIIFYMVGII